jgi:hypothetical protein
MILRSGLDAELPSYEVYEELCPEVIFQHLLCMWVDCWYLFPQDDFHSFMIEAMRVKVQ